MQDFLWNPAWDTGVPEIDEQHHELFRRMGVLAVSLFQEREEVETGKVLIFLRQYVEFHFDAEESIMEKGGYQGLDRHKAIHDAMRGQVQSLVDSYLAGGKDLPGSLMDYLVSWLLDHIDKEDRAMASFLKSQSSH